MKLYGYFVELCFKACVAGSGGSHNISEEVEKQCLEGCMNKLDELNALIDRIPSPQNDAIGLE